MGSYNVLDYDMNRFQKSVRDLSDSVNRAGIEWKDAKYADLKNSISSIARDSKTVMQASEHLQFALSRFNEISSEN